MLVEQIYTQCLAQGAYYLESHGEAAIIDPLREYQPYLDLAKKRGTKIRYIFETHFHADFVSGHMDLARETGATIVFGPTQMKTGFPAHIGFDGEVFPLGDTRIKLIHTPGHTMESSCFLLEDEQGQPTALFTGDTLFIGDVGRPDLAQHVISEMTPEKLASHLYDSLRNKILPLPDDLVVYPGHGAGSACGKNMSKETSDTLGNQKANNAALRPGLGKEQFIKELLSGLMPPPGYFPENVKMNIGGYHSLISILEHGTKAWNADAFEKMAKEKDVLILDTRSSKEFASGFIPGSIQIGLDGSFAPWVGTVLPDIKQKILFICEPGKEQDVLIRLSRVGYDHPIGYLEGGFDAWTYAKKPTDTIASVSSEELSQLKKQNPDLNILDVRKKSEFDSEHVVGATSAPLDYINESQNIPDQDNTWYVHCAGGYRSMIFISLLRRKGFRNLVQVDGGFSAMKATGGFPLTEYVCPTTML
jgi:glyoxylase-like metal-dependent hydrolase (beta-lactamase superfamily II)/rhodanese-related sulfurtransferase